MNIAVIFAGGTGSRMKTKTTPKQFLELNGKAILIHTLEHFENHPEIDGIVVVCIKDWIDHCWNLIRKNNLTKVKFVVEGGETGQLSIYNGVKKAYEEFPAESIVLVHDGVRPLINEQVISDNIALVKSHGCAITVVPVVETVVLSEESEINDVLERKFCHLARAPQSFFLGELYDVHQKAIASGMINSIDSATLMKAFGKRLFTVDGPMENIKITTPIDFYIFRAIYEARENSQIFGI